MYECSTYMGVFVRYGKTLTKKNTTEVTFFMTFALKRKIDDFTFISEKRFYSNIRNTILH